ncbi:MAG: UPF0175 family protein [Candidatus Aminicenantes bacterium]|nr:UPF0175 family protein [Candidatus Aminicenantes bacterium]
MHREMRIKMPEEIFIVLKKDDRELSGEILQKAAIQYYIEKELSLERAAFMCGLSRMEFIDVLYRLHVPIFDYSEEDLEEIHRERDEILERVRVK